MALAEDLAIRVGVALDNARMYEESLKMQQDLLRLNEAKDEFLGMVSHELRTPITTIYGGARVLHDRRNISDEDRRVMLGDIIEESERLRRLIEDLLVLARVELGEHLLTEPVQIQSAIHKQIDVLHRRMPGRKVELDLEDGLPPVLASPTYLGQVFRNLVDNAIKYSPPDTPIHFAAHRRNEGELVVAVTSGGAEVPAEDIERMFERFYRARSAADQKTGAGIGLTVCRRLVEAQNGVIWAEAQPGGGLRISFSLPFCGE
jgi:signal transduction histidine kinase